MQVTCRICGEKIEHILLLEHAATKHADKEAMKALTEIMKMTEKDFQSYDQLYDNLGVRWLSIGLDMLQRVMIREDLKVMHIFVNGGAFEVEVTKISAMPGAMADIEEREGKR